MQYRRADIFGRTVRDVEDKVNEAVGIRDKIKIVESFLLQQLTDVRSDNFVAHCIASMAQSEVTGIPAIIKKFKVSERHVQRLFAMHVGLAPKALQRILRLQQGLKMIQQKAFPSLSAISFHLGYHDQAHFTNDFKQFTGLSPQQFFANDHRLSDFFINH